MKRALLLPLLLAACDASPGVPRPTTYTHTDKELGLSFQFARNLQLVRNPKGDARFMIIYPNYKGGFSPTMTLESRTVEGDATTDSFAQGEIEAFAQGGDMQGEPETVTINGREFVTCELLTQGMRVRFYLHLDAGRRLGLTFQLMDQPDGKAMEKFIAAMRTVKIST